MQARWRHLSDEEVLLFVDRELPSRRDAQARAHLEHCESCSKRRDELESTLAQLVRVHEETIKEANGVSGSAHIRFRARLQARNSRIRQRPWLARPLLPLIARQAVCAGITLLIVATGYQAIHHHSQKGFHSNAAGYSSVSLPRRSLTPGAIRPVPVEELCHTRPVDNDPPVSGPLQQAVFSEYGLAASSQSEYQLDYLITPALGGSGDIKNLWPQAYSSTWNAQAKDQLEEHLHQLVCEHKLQLETAQNAIATDWILAYKTYIGVDAPRFETSLVVLPAEIPD